MPLTSVGAASLGRSGLGRDICSSFFFAIGLHCNLLPYHPPLPVCVSSHSQKILHPHHPHRCYSASISFPLSPLTSFFAEPESGSWYVSWTLLTTICFGVGVVVCCHPLSLGNRCSVSLYFMVSPFALENDKGSLLI